MADLTLDFKASARGIMSDEHYVDVGIAVASCNYETTMMMTASKAAAAVNLSKGTN